MIKALFQHADQYDWDNATQFYPSEDDPAASCKCYLIHPSDAQHASEKYCAKVHPITESQKKYLDPQEQEKILQQVLIHNSLNHNAILKFVGFTMYQPAKSHVSADGTEEIATPLSSPIILTEYMEGHSLLRLLRDIKTNGEPDFWNFTAKQICVIGLAGALRHIHRKGFVHLNLQPSTILFDQNYYPKISGFKYARSLTASDNTSYEVDPSNLYLSPDVHECKETALSQVADVYSYGLIIYSILTDELIENPFTIDTDVMRANLNKNNIGKVFIEFLLKCFDPDPFSQECKETNTRIIFDYIFEQVSQSLEYMINQNINQSDVQEYMDMIEDNLTDKGKVQLQIFETALQFGYPEIPEKIGFDEALKKDITSMPPNEVLMLFKEFIRNLSNNVERPNSRKDCELFSQLTQIAQSIPDNDPYAKQAQDFLNKAFGPVERSQSDAYNQERARSSKHNSTFNLSKTIKYIAPDTFRGMAAISRINLPIGLQKIEQNAFFGCAGLCWINLPDEITEIPPHCFDGCEKLQYVRLPSKLQTVRKYAFYKCKSLTIMRLPSTVTKIKKHAFSHCQRLSILEVPQNCKIHASAFGWKKVQRY